MCAAPPHPHAGAELRVVDVPGFVFRLGTHAARGHLPPHTHDDPTICYVVRGGFTEYCGGESVECPPSTLKLMPAGEVHWDEFGTLETRGLRIDVDRERFAGTPAMYRMLDQRLMTSGGRAAEVGRRLVRELTAWDTASAIAAEALALELVVELARGTDHARGRGTPRWLLAAEEVVRARYRTRVSVSEIARQLEVHPATLARGYRRRFGFTIGEHVRRLRVEQAARELVETGDPLSEIALRAGFYDQSHFTNVFRRVVGMTPAAYRRSA
jgi:AraC family transcriptional regulator